MFQKDGRRKQQISQIENKEQNDGFEVHQIDNDSLRDVGGSRRLRETDLDQDFITLPHMPALEW